MSALSIRHMNFAMVEIEYMREAQTKTMPRSDEAVYYWHISRKSKSRFPRKGERQWVFVRDFIGTKADVAELWCKWFRDGQHRLKLILKYPTKGQ